MEEEWWRGSQEGMGTKSSRSLKWIISTWQPRRALRKQVKWMEQLENHKLDPNGQKKIPGTNTQNSPEDHSYSREVEKKTQKSRVTCQPMVLKAAQVLPVFLSSPQYLIFWTNSHWVWTPYPPGQHLRKGSNHLWASNWGWRGQAHQKIISGPFWGRNSGCYQIFHLFLHRSQPSLKLRICYEF